MKNNGIIKGMFITLSQAPGSLVNYLVLRPSGVEIMQNEIKKIWATAKKLQIPDKYILDSLKNLSPYTLKDLQAFRASLNHFLGENNNE
jgi:hypothetical protein